MYQYELLILGTMLSACLGAAVPAQEGNNPQFSNSSKCATECVDSSQPQQFVIASAATGSTPALNGTGSILVGGLSRIYPLVGATLSAGMDDNPTEHSMSHLSGVYIASPYIGIVMNTPRVHSVVQYQPTLTGFTASEYSADTLHVASAVITGSSGARWDWTFATTASHGDQSVQLVAPQQSKKIGDVFGVDPNAAAYVPNSDVLTYVDAHFSVGYRRSERSSILAAVDNTFARYSDLHQQNSIVALTVEEGYGISARLGLTPYVQSAYFYGQTSCESVGAGLGITWRMREHSSLALRAGPQLGVPGCFTHGVSYSAAFSTIVTGRSQLYLSAAHQPAISYVGPGLWQTSAAGGIQRTLTSKTAAGIDVGYVESSSSTGAGSYEGRYLNAGVMRSLTAGMSCSISYRRYSGYGPGNVNRNVTMFSISWSPRLADTNPVSLMQ